MWFCFAIIALFLLSFGAVIGIEIFTDWDAERIRKKRQRIYNCKYQIFITNGFFYTADDYCQTYDGITFTDKKTGLQIYLREREYGINFPVSKYWKLLDSFNAYIN